MFKLYIYIYIFAQFSNNEVFIEFSIWQLVISAPRQLTMNERILLFFFERAWKHLVLRDNCADLLPSECKKYR